MKQVIVAGDVAQLILWPMMMVGLMRGNWPMWLVFPLAWFGLMTLVIRDIGNVLDEKEK